MSYVYIALTILFTGYGQLILKWQVSLAGVMTIWPVCSVGMLRSLWK